MNIKKPIAIMVAAATIASFSFVMLPVDGQAHAAAQWSAAQKVIQTGTKYWGAPYEFGSNRNSTRTFDCSDFTRQAFLEGAGIEIPSDSRQQAAYVKRIGDTTTNWKKLQPGDLMFFMSYRGYKKSSYSGISKWKQRITHVGIYIGNGKVLHTYSRESGGVRVDRIENTHWESRFIFGGSALK